MRANKGFATTAVIFFLAISTSLAAGASTLSQKSEATILEPARIYFKSRQYKLSFNQYNKYLKLFPKGKQIQEANYFLARCDIELAGKNKVRLQEAISRFSKIQKNYPRGNFSSRISHWTGRAYMALAALGKPGEAIKAYQLAIDNFKIIMDNIKRSKLDFDSRFLHASSLGLMGKLLSNDRDKVAKFDDAINSLQLLIINYPTNKDRPKAAAKLVKYFFLAHHYERAIASAKDFVKTFPKSSLLAEVYFNEAESLYFSGLLTEAITQYKKAAKQTVGHPKLQNVATDARLGSGWSYARLAATEQPSTRGKYLSPAVNSFRRALEKLPKSDLRRAPALYKLAEALIGLGENKQSLAPLQELLQVEKYQVRANYLAGKAYADSKNYRSAYAHFTVAGKMALTSQHKQIAINSQISLAKIELKLNRPARAVLYYQQAAFQARKTRDHGIFAKTGLGQAVSLLQLAYPEEKRKKPLHNDLTQQAIRLLLAANYHPGVVEKLSEEISFSAQAALLRQQPAAYLLQQSINLINLLVQSYAERLRLDELYFYKGKALAVLGYAKLSQLDLTLAGPKLRREKCRENLSWLDKAQEALNRSLSANPRGTFAGKSLYELGLCRYRSGTFCLKIAEKLISRSDNKNAQIYQELANKYMEVATGSLLQIQGVPKPRALKYKAQFLLSLSYSESDKEDKAMNILKKMLKKSGLPASLRLKTASQLAKILLAQNRLVEALDLITPYAKSNLSRQMLLQTSNIYSRLKSYRKGRKLLLQVKKFPPPATRAERKKQAEVLLQAHTLGLEAAMLPASPPDKQSLIKDSIAGLKQVAEKYSETPAAAKALLALGEHYLDLKKFKMALKQVDQGLNLFPAAVARQTMYLLAGKILRREAGDLLQKGKKDIASQRLNKAMEYFRKAETTRFFTEEGSILKIKALLELARAYADKGELENAIKRYSFIFAHYPGSADIADTARLEVAKILRKQHKFTSALAILEGAFDRNKTQTLIHEIEEKQRTGKSKSESIPGQEK